MAVSADSEARLRAAMERLLAGRAERTEGALSIAGLAREAGVGRATATRATALLAEFRARRELRDADPERVATHRERIRALERELSAMRGAERREILALRQALELAAHSILALTLENAARRNPSAGA